ncbi:MAG: HEAT repeat domain-containing protein [Bacteroidota bacterium]
MRQSLLFHSAFALLATATILHAQPSTPLPRAAAAPRPDRAPALSLGALQPEQSDDPAYSTYREGYTLILNERWDEARKKLADVIAKHPKSDYADDARYWTAYALRHQDHKKARAAYEAFVEAYPKSSYYDDAVADLAQLESDGVYVIAPGEGTPTAISITKSPGGGYSVAPHMRDVERQLRRQSRSMARWRHPAMSIGTPMAFENRRELDPETRLKMEALYALGEAKEDEKSFSTLRDIALDSKQALALREASLDVLVDFKKHDILPVLMEIALKDTHEQLQAYAIDFIGNEAPDKNKSVGLLIELFNNIPKHRVETVETIFYAIAEVGNDKAVDFLRTVALTHDNYQFRRDAVYYLGNIGGEKARSALYEILKGK